jgi:hypothetical protein
MLGRFDLKLGRTETCFAVTNMLSRTDLMLGRTDLMFGIT